LPLLEWERVRTDWLTVGEAPHPEATDASVA